MSSFRTVTYNWHVGRLLTSFEVKRAAARLPEVDARFKLITHDPGARWEYERGTVYFTKIPRAGRLRGRRRNIPLPDQGRILLSVTARDPEEVARDIRGKLFAPLIVGEDSSTGSKGWCVDVPVELMESFDEGDIPSRDELRSLYGRPRVSWSGGGWHVSVLTESAALVVMSGYVFDVWGDERAEPGMVRLIVRGPDACDKLDEVAQRLGIEKSAYRKRRIGGGFVRGWVSE